MRANGRKRPSLHFHDMQITFKQVGEYGLLSRRAKTAGWTLMVLAAACGFTGAFLSLRSASKIAQGLDSKSSEELHQAVDAMIRQMGAFGALFWAAFALVILSLGCFLFGRRTPPASPGKEA